MNFPFLVSSASIFSHRRSLLLGTWNQFITRDLEQFGIDTYFPFIFPINNPARNFEQCFPW